LDDLFNGCIEFVKRKTTVRRRGYLLRAASWIVTIDVCMRHAVGIDPEQWREWVQAAAAVSDFLAVSSCCIPLSKKDVAHIEAEAELKCVLPLQILFCV
jgi:hypothetical protein